MAKIAFIILGSFFLAVGAVGVVVPGLPTTVFLLLAAACYVRSSKRLYKWLIEHKLFGKLIREYRDNGTIPLRSKIFALTMMSTMITLSVLLWIESTILKIVVIGLGIVGTVVVLRIPSSRDS